MAVLQEDEIEYVDPEAGVLRYKSGVERPLDEQEMFHLTSSGRQRELKEKSKQMELASGKDAMGAFSKGAKSNLFYNLGQGYISDVVTSALEGVPTGEGQEGSNYFQRVGEAYTAKRLGRREAVQEIEEESPIASMLGKATALGIDVAMPLPVKSPTAQGAMIGFGGSDRTLFEDPMEVAKQTAMGGTIGYGAGKIGQSLERVAQERRALREFPKIEQEAKRAYNQNLQNFRSNAMKKIEASQRDIGKYGVAKDALGIDEFIQKEIGLSEYAGTKEAVQLEKFLNTMEKSLPQDIMASDLAKMYEAIEMRIARGLENEVPVLNKLKEHLVERIPQGSVKNQIMGKIVPKVEKQTAKVIDQVFESLPKNVVKEIEREFGKDAVKLLKDDLKLSINETLSSMSPEEIINFLGSGDSSLFMESLANSPAFQNMQNLSQYKALQMSGNDVNLGNLLKKNMPSTVFETETRLQSLPGKLQQRFDAVLQRNAIDASILANESQRKVASRISNATGVPNPYTGRSATNPPVAPYQAPTPPQVGRMADRFENTTLDWRGKGQSAFGIGALGKLFGVPKIGAAVAAGQGIKAGLEGTLRGLTSPGAISSATRKTIQGGGMRLTVEKIASSFDSYDRGILNDPQERKLAVSQIETDPDLELEDKAVLQTYINRGKNLEQFLR